MLCVHGIHVNFFLCREYIFKFEIFHVKVHKQGNKVGRAIDLSKMSSYHELFNELESLFQMEGILSNPDGAWRLLYTDEENDMMVVGDDPWE